MLLLPNLYWCSQMRSAHLNFSQYPLLFLPFLHLTHSASSAPGKTTGGPGVRREEGEARTLESLAWLKPYHLPLAPSTGCCGKHEGSLWSSCHHWGLSPAELEQIRSGSWLTGPPSVPHFFCTIKAFLFLADDLLFLFWSITIISWFNIYHLIICCC